MQVMLILGGVCGAIVQSQDSRATARSLRRWYHISPQVVLWALVPALVFERALNTNGIQAFLKMKCQIFTLGGPGLLLGEHRRPSYFFTVRKVI